MAKRYRYAIIKKKEAKKGKLSVGLAIASLLLLGRQLALLMHSKAVTDLL